MFSIEIDFVMKIMIDSDVEPSYLVDLLHDCFELLAMAPLS